MEPDQGRAVAALGRRPLMFERSHTYQSDALPECHQLMLENRHPCGNMAVLVNAVQPGSGAASSAAGNVVRA